MSNNFHIKDFNEPPIDATKRNVEVIGPDVEDWLRRANETEDKIDAIYQCVSDNGKGCLNVCFLNLRSQYSVSKKAKKMIKVRLLSFKIPVGLKGYQFLHPQAG